MVTQNNTNTNTTPSTKPQKKNDDAEQKKLIQEMLNQVRELTKRVKSLEENSSMFRKRVDVVDDNMLSSSRKLNALVEEQRSEIEEYKKELFEMKDMLSKLVKDIHTFAKLEDVLSLEDFVNFWDPVKFVTVNEVSKIVENAISDKIDEIELKLKVEKYVNSKLKQVVTNFIKELNEGKIKINTKPEDKN